MRIRKIGLLGIGDDGTLYEPNGWRICQLPMRVAVLIQKFWNWLVVIG